MNMARNDKEGWENLRQELTGFGKESGMFADLQVRQLGKSSSDPFQIRIKAHGPEVNLIDTGYGISQILPILVNILRPSGEMLLMQQPEVHLHPRGQAALASLLVQKFNPRRQNPLSGCVIETHSDYMIDRARIEIRRGNIPPDDVSLIYLEKNKQGVQSHNITFDKQGNMENAPSSYGEFFLKESDRLLGFEE